MISLRGTLPTALCSIAVVSILMTAHSLPAQSADAAAPAAKAAAGAASEKDGAWTLSDGTPIYHVDKDGTVDWYTASGFLRYGANCLQCHGPDGLGSTYAPDLTAALKTMDYSTFMATVSEGKRTKEGATEFVMPALGTDKNVMCYITDIYVYLKGRSDGVVGRGRPDKNAKPPASWEKSTNECMG